MAIDPVQEVHSSPVVQNLEAVDNAQRNPTPTRPSPPLPQDKVTISPAAQAQQTPAAAHRARDAQ